MRYIKIYDVKTDYINGPGTYGYKIADIVGKYYTCGTTGCNFIAVKCRICKYFTHINGAHFSKLAHHIITKHWKVDISQSYDINTHILLIPPGDDYGTGDVPFHAHNDGWNVSNFPIVLSINFGVSRNEYLLSLCGDFTTLHEYTDEISTIHTKTTIYDNTEIAKKILTRCILCGLWYDSVPTELIVETHLLTHSVD